MICPRCGRMNDEHRDYCAFCGAVMGGRAHSSGNPQPVEETRLPQTDVLSANYGEYCETVVEPATSFDPSLFMGQASGSGAVPNQPASAQPSLSPQPAWPNATTTSAASVSAAPAWTTAQGDTASLNGSVGSNESTWVLGASGSGSVGQTPVQTVSQNAQPTIRYQAPTDGYDATPFPVDDSYVTPVSPQTFSWGAGGGAQFPSYHAPEKKQTNPVIIGLGIALGVIVVVAATVIVLTMFGPTETKSTTRSTGAATTVPAVSESASSASDAAGTEYSGDSATTNGSDGAVHNPGGEATAQYPPGGGGSSNGLTDSEAYKLLLEYYDNAADYDKSISDCADAFNKNYKTESKSVRSSKATAASNLKSQIKADWDKLKKLDMPFWSKNKEAWEELCTCYEYLWDRIDVIDQAWTISLQYETEEDLKKHEKEILAPINADKESNGQNKYYTLFKELYPSIEIVNPNGTRL